MALEQTLKEAPKVGVEAINKRKQNRLGKSIADDDLGLDNFGITKKIKKIMVEQQKKMRRCWQRSTRPKEGMSLSCLLLLVHLQ